MRARRQRDCAWLSHVCVCVCVLMYTYRVDEETGRGSEEVARASAVLVSSS